MERLTKRYTYNRKPEVSVDSKINGISCSNFCTSCGKADCEDIRKALFKLAEYEDLEEQGKLLKLPVSVGDTVYRVRCETFVERCNILGFAESRTVCYMVYIDPDEKDVIELSDFGKTVFLTRESAEAALKEMSE